MECDHQTTLFVVLITWCLSVGSISRALAESQLIGSPPPIIAVAGDDVILPCSLESPINAEEMTVAWSRPGMDPEYVHLYRNGRDIVRDQNTSYSYRTSLFKGELINGNVSLKLFRVKLEDEGKYTCLIPSFSRVEEVIQLIVVAVSEPKISILEVNNTGRVLQCESEGWYPEPQLEWREGPKDSEGRLLSTKDTQTHREPDGRYTVRSSVTVQKTDTNKFTCRVQLMKFNLKREAEIHVFGDMFPTQPTDGSSLPGWEKGLIGLMVGVVVGVVVVPALGRVWRKGSRNFAERATLLKTRLKATLLGPISTKDHVPSSRPDPDPGNVDRSASPEHCLHQNQTDKIGTAQHLQNIVYTRIKPMK